MSAFLDSLLQSGGADQDVPRSVGMKALAWARVSTDMQEERGLSMPEQLRQIREYAEKQGIEIVDEYYEAASAFRKESQRVEFHKMLERAKTDRAVSAIIVHDFSRFSRDSLRARTLIRDLKQRGIRVMSLNDLEIDPETVAGVYMEAITFAKNEAYSREVAFHTKKGCRANVQSRDPETSWCYKNGGQPLFGYKAERLMRGEEKKGRPRIKSIWVPDDRVVAGKPIHEWARHCLVELAGKGATLDQLRDFCNTNGIPAPRQEFWGHTTWRSLLDTHCLLQFAGYGVWNVRGKAQRVNPPSEWIIVENAHPALITEAEAEQIIAARQLNKDKRFDKGYHRSKDSDFLLSGGLFTCARCGSNLLGIRKSRTHSYYVCGSQPHRRGMGCGTAVYVPHAEIEREVFSGLGSLLSFSTDPERFTRKVNEELKRLWQESTGFDGSAKTKVGDIDTKIANIRKSIEDGMPDTEWAYARMRELLAEKQRLESASVVSGQAPQIDPNTAMAYRRQTEKILATGTNVERKKLLRSCVDHIQLAPESLEVEITYKVPEHLVNIVGAGRGFEPLTFGL